MPDADASTVHAARPMQRRPWWALAVKRLLDVFLAGIALVVLSPALVLIAGALKVCSPGPLLYRWRVVGEGGQPFVGYKFRTMVVDADAQRDALGLRNQMTGPVFKLRDDPRVTRVGGVLRRYSLDELPQLWSVLLGDMSLVGPRPPLQTEYREFTPLEQRKLSVKPGMTCLWQVSGRNEISDFNDWLRLDLEYIDSWSLLLDLKILLWTIPAVIRGRGAY